MALTKIKHTAPADSAVQGAVKLDTAFDAIDANTAAVGTAGSNATSALNAATVATAQLNFSFSAQTPITATQARINMLSQQTAGTLVGNPLVMTSDAGLQMWNGTQLVSAGRVTLSKQTVPVVLFIGGIAVGVNGAITFPVALPAAYTNCWVWFADSDLYTTNGGNAAGLYLVQMSSTTVGTAFDNHMVTGIPQLIPVSPLAIVSSSVGNSTVAIGQGYTMAQANAAAFIVGPSGSLEIAHEWLTSSSAFSKRCTPVLGGQAITTSDSETTAGIRRDVHTVSATGTQKSQSCASTTSGAPGAVVGFVQTTVDLTTANSIYVGGQFDQSTAYVSGTTYASGATVSSVGINYLSLQSANTGNTPASSPTFWAPQQEYLILNSFIVELVPCGLLDFPPTTVANIPPTGPTIVPLSAQSLGLTAANLAWYFNPTVSDISFTTATTTKLAAGLAYQYSGANAPWNQSGTVGAAAYNSGTTYAAAAVVSSGGVNYFSLQASNVGHTPASSPTFWLAQSGPYAAMVTDGLPAQSVLRLRQKGDGVTPGVMTSTGNKTAGLLRYLSVANNWVAGWVARISNNHQDHWDAYWMLPDYHDVSGSKPYWELDVHEGGYGNTGDPFYGMHTSLLDWAAGSGSPGSMIVHNNLATSRANYGPSLDLTQYNTFEIAWNASTGVVQPWINNQMMPFSFNLRTTDATAINGSSFFSIAGPQQHGKQVPFDMYLAAMYAWGG